MRHYPRFEALRKRDRQRILDEYPEFLASVARRSGKSKATVSRVFAGLIRRSPDVKQAIEQELSAMTEEVSLARHGIEPKRVLMLRPVRDGGENAETGERTK